MSRLQVWLLFAAVLYASPSAAFRPVTAAGCSSVSNLFIYDLRSQCPAAIPPNPPIEVDGNFLDKILSNRNTNSFTCILFYASWCPFSNGMRPKFEMLSSMFPQVEHFTVERSAALPSVFSRYGIHSLPSIIMANQTSKWWYHEDKDTHSLIQFYKKSTGLEPVRYFPEKPYIVKECSYCILQREYILSLEDMMKREPYLLLATLFTLLRVIFFFTPLLLFRSKAFYFSCIRHFNMEIFGRVLHMVDIRRVWTRMRLCKTRNFHARARSCRVWASSFTSVSLGESR